MPHQWYLLFIRHIIHSKELLTLIQPASYIFPPKSWKLHLYNPTVCLWISPWFLTTRPSFPVAATFLTYNLIFSISSYINLAIVSLKPSFSFLVLDLVWLGILTNSWSRKHSMTQNCNKLYPTNQEHQLIIKNHNWLNYLTPTHIFLTRK